MKKDVRMIIKAPWWKRLLGKLVDVVVLFAIAWICFRDMVFGGSPVFADWYVATASLGLLAFLWFSIPYYLITEGIFGRTPGKLVVGTIVVDIDSGGKPGFGKVLGRTFSRFIPFDRLSFISAFPEGWHDVVSGTVVLNMCDYKNEDMQTEEPSLDTYPEFLSEKTREMTPSPGWKRLLGGLVDSIVACLFGMTIIYLISELISEYGNGYSSRYNNGYLEGLSSLVVFLSPVPYYLIFEGIFGRTLGKLITGTIVVDINSGDKAGFGRILGRTLSRFIPFEGFSFISAFPRGCHDEISGTIVLNMRDYKRLRRKKSNGFFALSMLSQGMRRLVFAVTAIISLRVLVTSIENIRHSDGASLLCLPIPWIVMYIGYWIYIGFREGKDK